jgi:hypothetical protein
MFGSKNKVNIEDTLTLIQYAAETVEELSKLPNVSRISVNACGVNVDFRTPTPGEVEVAPMTPAEAHEFAVTGL